VDQELTRLQTRIPKQTVNDWKNQLSDWTAPDAFRQRVDHICQSIPRTTFFKQAGLTFVRDAWIGARVADALSTEAIRLVPTHRPDFEIRWADRVLQFEATEADMDGRRRGDETDGPRLQMDPVENWRRRFNAIPAALDRVVTKKLEKNYSAAVSLAIYVNLGCYGAYIDEGLPILRHHTERAKGKFKSVFVMWEGMLYKFWENGSAVLETWQYNRHGNF
jgi:hypothetical protein